MTFHVFAGHPDIRDGPARVVHVKIDGAGYQCGPLAHHVKHSPDGFSWGYGGSGPSELARCLLIASLDGAGLCGACDGRGRRGGEACWYCSAVGFNQLVEGNYMQVRDRLVSRCPQDQPLAVTSRDVRYAAGLDREPA